MTEYIVEVDDKVAEAFIERFDWKAVTLYGHHLVGEIVRCRDCRRCVEYDTWNPEGTALNCNHWGCDTEPDGFCAWGERREK